MYCLEKVAWLWGDGAGNPAAAARTYEEVLAIDAKRTSAIRGLASAAARAGDAKRLAQAHLAEAAAIESASPADERKGRSAPARRGGARPPPPAGPAKGGPAA